jgi:alkanesulfonate monooxygenase SsuD/methylene tetrahydromethanopterin reductase-like flavin-dependent oxidoreductase (luciferase family)
MMRLGALLGPIADPSNAATLAEQARTYVGEGLDSLWSAQAVGRGFMNTDPIVALSVAAAVTQGVELGTAVLQVPLYHPVDLAHRIFSLMQVCGSRLIFGIGAGSTENDFAAFDRPYQSRFQDFSSCVARLRTLFAEGASEGVDLSPWPNLKGGPPLFLGSWGNGVERAAKSFDGWIASGHYRSPEEVIGALQRYRDAGGGRAIVSTLLLGADVDLGELRERLGKFADAGFDDAVVMFMPGGPTPAQVRELVP